MSFRVNCIKATAFAAACMLPLFVTGCAGLASNAGGSGNVTGASVTLAGKTYGAFNPISGATVDLYLAGTAGYGGGAQLVAHASSGTDGSFSFSNTPGAANDNSGSTYTCPASGDPLVYLVSRGGNTSGSTGTGQNTASVLMTLLGPCSTDGGAVTINEATTVGAIFAMQQFISITTADIFIGAPSTTSAATGIKNAYSTFLNLIDPQHGVVRTTFTPVSTAGGVTMTGTTESTKLITIANILAGCVNQVDNTKTPCTSLMTDAVPPTYQTTNQAVSSYVAATDTAMATYYLAVNPTQSQDGTARNSAIYNLSTGYTPFGAGLGGAPSDWTLAITYVATGTCTNAAAANPFNAPKQLAIDASGNIWIANGAPTADAIVEVAPTGGVSACLDGTIVYGNSVVLDTVGSVWYTAEGSSTTVGDAVWQYKGSGTPVSWPVTTGYQPYLVVADTGGNIIMSSFAAVSSSYKPQIYVGAATATSTSASINGASTGAAGRPLGLTVSYYPTTSTLPYLYAPGSSSLYVFSPLTAGSNPPGSYSSYGSTTEKYAYRIATDNNGLVIGASQAGSSGTTATTGAPYTTWFQSTPGVTTATLSTPFLGGMNYMGGVAVDGVNNYWAGLGLPVVGTTTFGLAEIRSDMLTALSPASTAGFADASCTNSACPTGGGFQLTNVSAPLYDTAIDSSGNIWATLYASAGAASNGLVQVVGAAAPVVTPLVSSLKSGN